MDTKLWFFKKLGCPTRVERTNQVGDEKPKNNMWFFSEDLDQILTEYLFEKHQAFFGDLYGFVVYNDISCNFYSELVHFHASEVVPCQRIGYRSQQCGCPPSMPVACPALCCLVLKPFHRARFLGVGAWGEFLEISVNFSGGVLVARKLGRVFVSSWMPRFST